MTEDYNNPEDTGNKGFEIKKFFFKAVSYWYLFVLSIIISFFAARWINKHAIPTYGLHATVMLKNESNEEEVAGGLTLFAKRKNIDTQMGILKSYSLSKEAVEELNFKTSYFQDERFKKNYEIYNKSPFVVNLDTTYHQYNNIPVYVIFQSKDKVKIIIEPFGVEKIIGIGQQFKYKDFSFNITFRDSLSYTPSILENKYFFIKNTVNSIVQDYLYRLEIEVSPERSSILWLWMVGTVPQKDADYLNKVIEIYIRNGLNEKNQKAKSIIKFIDEQLESVSDSLKVTENNMQIFKQKNRSVDISNEGMLLLTKLTELQKYEETQKKKLSYYKYIKAQLNNNKVANSLTAPTVMDINDPVLLSYLEKLTEAVTQRDELDFSVRSDIPISEKLDLQIQNIQNQIRIHSQKNIDVTENEIQTVNRNIAKVNSDINRLPVSERQIINIQRKFNINDEIYTLLLRRRTEAAITQASNKADTKMLDPARPETAEKKSPDTGGNTKKGILFGLLIPILLIIVLEFFNNKIEDKSDIESRTNIPIYGTVGRNKTKTNLAAAKHPKAPITEAFRALRTNMQFVLKGKEKKIIVVSSSVSGEGKSFISVNLASVIALSEKKTLLVGLDLRKSKLQNEFTYNNQNGISSFLVNRCNFDDVIQKSSIEHLSLALSGPIPPNPAELIESEKMKEFFTKAMKKFDYIIVDTPPIAVVTDALLLNEIADAFLYVVRQSFSSKNVIKLLEDAKKEGNLKNIGIILNDVEIKKGYGYSHGYGYGYGYGYGQGYYGEFDDQKESFIDKFLKSLKIKKS